MDFNSVLWVRPDAEGGNVVVDPMPLSEHDLAHIERLGGVGWVVVTNSDHIREAAALRERFGAKIAGPAGEAEGFGVPLDRALSDGDELVPGLVAYALEGSKTAGELALVLDGETLITGDLVRAPVAGRLAALPVAKLSDVAAARASVERLAALDAVEVVLVGDGWPLFAGGHAALRALAASMG